MNNLDRLNHNLKILNKPQFLDEIKVQKLSDGKEVFALNWYAQIPWIGRMICRMYINFFFGRENHLIQILQIDVQDVRMWLNSQDIVTRTNETSAYQICLLAQIRFCKLADQEFYRNNERLLTHDELL